MSLLSQALKPSDQASALFATVSALLGVLLATAALLLSVPDRRAMIADLRLAENARRAAARCRACDRDRQLRHRLGAAAA